MKLVYRIEVPGKSLWVQDSIGTFRGRSYYAYNRNKRVGKLCNSHPNPYCDEELQTPLNKLFQGPGWFRSRRDSSRNYYFAFDSIDQLVEWFPCPKGRYAMCNIAEHKREGADKTQISIYRTKKIVRGNHQCAFHKDQAIRVGRLDPKTLKRIEQWW